MPLRSDLETVDQLFQAAGLLRQRVTVLQCFIEVGHALLVQQVDLVDVDIEGFHHRGLLLGGSGDRLVHAVDFNNPLRHADQALTGLVGDFDALFAGGLARVHGGHRFTRTHLQRSNHFVDFLRRLLGTVSQVAHFIGDHGKPATRFPGTGGLNRGVEREQVGLLGDTFDHIENVADVIGAGVQGLDLGAGQADLLRQFGHRQDGFLHHFAPIVSLLAGTTGVLGSVSGVTRDFLGRGAQFVDCRGYAVGARALLVRTDDRSVGRRHYALGQVMHLACCRGHLGNRGVDTLDELVEGTAYPAKLIFSGHVQAAGQVTLTLGDVPHGNAHGGQRPQQYLDQQAQEHRNRHHGNQHGNQRGGAEFTQGCVGFVFINRQADVPVRTWQAGDRGEGQNAILTVEDNILVKLLDADAGAWVDVLEVLHHLALIGADDDLTVAADQERMADAAEVYRVDDLHQRLQAQVTTDHAQQLAVLFHRHGDGHDLPTHGCHVRRGQHRFVSRHGLLVPRTLARVIAIGHFCVGTLGEHAVGLADVSELEVRGECGLINQAWKICSTALVGHVLCQVFEYQHAATEPVLHTAGGEFSGLLDGRLQVLFDGAAL